MKIHRKYSFYYAAKRHLRNTKLAAALFSVLAVILLSGCSAAEDWVLKHSGVIPEEDVQAYLELKNTGRLDEQGFYKPVIADEGLREEGEDGADGNREHIHVTFGENPYLEISYYLDKELTNPVDTENCYVNPGDCLYAGEPVYRPSAGSLYRFDQFHIYDWADGSAAPRERFWEKEDGESPLVIRIPEDYSGAELSVMPAGRFEKREISLTAYYIDTAGTKQEAESGTWMVNGKKETAKTVSVSWTQQMNVEYHYDEKKYSYVSSHPAALYAADGLVSFKPGEAEDLVSEYSVELRPVGNEFLFDPSQYETDHGKVTFLYDGRPVTEKRYFSEGTVIRYTAEPDPGYHHPKENGEIEIRCSDMGGTEEKLQKAIRFYPDGDVTVYLPQPQKGGTIRYSADGKILTGESCQVSAGTVITMEFDNWTGWESRVLDGAEYTVKDEEGSLQTVTIEGADIYDIFYEVDQYKPELKLVLHESVQGALLGISAKGVQMENLTYGEKDKSTWISDLTNRNNRTVFSGKLGGTDQDIIVTMTNDVILPGSALKMEIVRTDSQDSRKEMIRYIKKLPAEEEIRIYESREIKNSQAVCKEITVTVSKVEVKSYTQRNVDHASLRLTLEDGGEEENALQDGDILEENRKVTVTLIPDEGYYVESASADQGIYTDTMTFAKWEKNGDKILDKHPVKKLRHVTLETDDDYGVCFYKLDGQEVSGTVALRQDQKLTLEYTLKDPEQYEIVREGIISRIEGLADGDNEKITIAVSDDTDGSTIKPGDYVTVRPKKGDS